MATQEIMIIRLPFTDDKGTHEAIVYEMLNDDEFTGKYRAVINGKESIVLGKKGDDWYEGEKITHRSNVIGKLIEDYEG
jgi:hypothetical protein